MKPSRIEIVVDFADCDPARIVYYPRFFDWFDRATERLFRDRGLPWAQMFADYKLAGLPIVDASAQFKGASRFGDAITVESWISEWRGKVFVVEHRVRKDDTVLVEGRELRVWGLRDPKDPEGVKAGPVPPEVIARFES
ncbi:MAG: thioesterase family protein [Alphaproteobacteria bacterium]